MHLIQRLMLLEKRHYPFRRWPKGHSAALLFPGCNFPGQYPKTMAYLEDLCRAPGMKPEQCALWPRWRSG